VNAPEGYDPDKGVFFFISGKKGSGKSVLARRVWDGYPYDKVVIDPTGDVLRDLRDEGVPHEVIPTDAIPIKLRKREDDEPPRIFVYVPDMGSDTAVDDMDRVMGLVLNYPGPMAVWCDEMGVYSRVNATPPNLRRALHHGRHDQLTLIQACPRPIWIDPLCIAQADVVVTFRTPNAADRKRIAEEIGIPPQEFDELVLGLHAYEHVWFDALANQGLGEVQIRPPLPARSRRVSHYVPPDNVN
jgi:hypothetical protein